MQELAEEFRKSKEISSDYKTGKVCCLLTTLPKFCRHLTVLSAIGRILFEFLSEYFSEFHLEI